MIRSLALLLALLLAPPAQAHLAKDSFGAMTRGSAERSEPFGGYSRGCAAGLEQLPETGPSWQAMRLSRNRNWGHPELVDMVRDLGTHMDRIGWGGIYVGDMSQPRGGPMTSGHRSHQIGLDADIWLYPATDMTLSPRARENISAVSMQREGGAYVNDRWSRGQHELVKRAAQDPRTARIFIFPGAKVRMCRDETGDRSWLRKVRPWWGHHYHMHVRISCPRGASGCEDQAAPPPGDGCAEAQAWVNNILNPPPPDPNAAPAAPRRDLRVADLPQQCARVLAAPSR
ncbi:Penicillin-insensitive murein endopeptidase precursor [Jannaschia seosinensis]|uniref:Penicillin-insensitive murein endopeptidase n=1 Tax=Jannaschia seosinensis TaxID=313367 RepID=A0A0M7B9N8_9RHOB|nr:penicillin-insensitive murein endopeptidase [Jannaschia seosinensis]CUH38786.1 Penicillin-insensitive murein endopeptidase precursor [Jannaschia seosinensis]